MNPSRGNGGHAAGDNGRLEPTDEAGITGSMVRVRTLKIHWKTRAYISLQNSQDWGIAPLLAFGLSSKSADAAHTARSYLST